MLKAFLLVVVGLSGDPEHGKTFHAWSNKLVEAADRLGVAPERLVYLVDQPGEGDKKVSGRSTREEIAKAIEAFAKQATADDLVIITLIGHGSFDGRSAKFNMPGADMGAADFAALLKKLPTKQVVFVNTASASSPFIAELSGPGRTVITATRTPAQVYATLFGGFFVDALTSDAADADKNKRISVLEAYQFARAEVERTYKQEGLLATEQSLLDDNGDKEGTQAPTLTTPDGKVASVVSLSTTAGDDLPADPKLRALHVERREMERRVELLRLLKESMDAAKYAAELETLLTSIARKSQEIRAAEKK